MNNKKVLILTHGDCDGVCSAALYKSIIKRDVTIFFTHPIGILDDLYDNIKANKYDKIVILDIALNENTWPDLIHTLNDLSKKDNIDVTYIDHHPLPNTYSNPPLKFKFIWGEGRSTSEITFQFLGDKIDKWMSRVALYGGIGDYSDETPFMRKMYSMWDKRLIYFEGGILTQALEGSRRDYDYKRRIIDILSKNKLPSKYEWIWNRALEMALKEEELRKLVEKRVKKIGVISFVEDVPGSIGRAARYAMVSGGGKIGIAIENRGNLAIMSVRTYRDGPDINKMLREIAPRFGGSGGGHKHAAGARIPRDKLYQFIDELNSYLEKISI